MASVRCPECGERVRVRGDKKLRCPECDRSFWPPDDQDEADDFEERESRPRASRPPMRRASSSRTKVVAGVVGGLVLVAVIVAVVLIARKGGKESTAPIDSSKVTIDNFRSLKVGMSLAEVEAVLGGSRSSSENELASAIRRGGITTDLSGWIGSQGTLQQKITSWRKWDGKNLQAWVAFVGTSDGEKAALSMALVPFEHGGSNLQTGFIQSPSDVEKESNLRKAENAVRNDAKWVRGPKAREFLTGEWSDVYADGYVFGSDGKLKEVDQFTFQIMEIPNDMFAARPGLTFRVVDDNHLEIVTPSPFLPLPGQPPPPAYVDTRPTVTAYEFYVNQDELVMIVPTKILRVDGDTTFRTLFRLPVLAGSPAEAKFLSPLLADLKGRDPEKWNDAFAKLRRQAKGITIALPALMDLVRNGDPIVADHAAYIIGEMKGQAASAVPGLIALLGDSNPKRVVAAMHGLGQLGSVAKEAVPTLRVLAARARNNEVQNAAGEAIGYIENARK